MATSPKKVSSITLTEVVVLTLVATAVVTWLFHWSISFVLLGVVGVILLVSAQQVKAADPPQVAIPTVWGSPIETVIKPRWALAFKFFPLVEDLIIVNTTLLEDEIEVNDVRCRVEESSGNPDDKGRNNQTPESGGSVKARIGLTYEVSTDPPGQAYEFVKAGQKEGVKKVLNNIVEEVMREEGSNHTWEHLTFSKAEISAKLIAMATGRQPEHRIKRGDGNRPIRDTTSSYQTYKLEPVEADYRFSELDYEAFLKEVLHNGYNDIYGLGIRIKRLNVMEITPEGELKADAERPAREQQQRRSEVADVKTNVEVARTLMEAANQGKNPGDPDYMTWETALKEARIQRGRAEQVFVEGSSGRAAVVNPQRKRNTGGTNS